MDILLWLCGVMVGISVGYLIGSRFTKSGLSPELEQELYELYLKRWKEGDIK